MACTFSTSQCPKVVRPWGAFNKFCFDMCFAPQWRALFRHLNVQKWSDHEVRLTIFASTCASRRNSVRLLNFQECSDNGVFVAFWLRNELCAALGCTFSTSQLPRVLRKCIVFSILTSKSASRHNSVHFLISPPAALASLLFNPPGPQNIGKTQRFVTLLPFRAPWFLSTESFSSDFFSSDCFSSVSSILFPPGAASSVHFVGSLTSKLPSIKPYLVT